jgi:hypothetical protein
MSGQSDSLRRLQALLSRAHEELDTELKGWLDFSTEEHKANLAQAILALANHGGGFVLIGFTKKNGSWVPEAQHPSDLEGYSQDCVNDIVQRYADPSFHCTVNHVLHPENGLLYPIVMVPGPHKVPIRAKRDGPNGQHVHQNLYYIRRPGPKSEPPQTGLEWGELIDRCIMAAREDLLERIREILQGVLTVPAISGKEDETKVFNDLIRELLQGGLSVTATSGKEDETKILNDWIDRSTSRFNELVKEKLRDEKPSRYSKGTWCVAYVIKGIKPFTSLAEFREVLNNVRGHESGWPPWWVPNRPEIASYSYNGLVECWLKDLRGDIFGNDRTDNFRFTGHSDFWQASPKGMMFLLRGYQEDSARDIEPGTIVDLILPIWRIGECLLHAERLAKAMKANEAPTIAFRCMWTGLANRTLVSWANPRRPFFGPRGPSKQDSVTSERIIPSDQISETLPELVKALTRPLYEAFDFYDVAANVVREELLNMRRGNLG